MRVVSDHALYFELSSDKTMPFKMQWPIGTVGPTGEHEKILMNRPTTVPPKRCVATTRSGNRCSIDTASSMRDASDNLVCEPLRRGGPHCRFHMSLFENNPTTVFQECRVFYIDFETTGLNVLTSEILEIGVTEVRMFVN